MLSRSLQAAKVTLTWSGKWKHCWHKWVDIVLKNNTQLSASWKDDFATPSCMSDALLWWESAKAAKRTALSAEYRLIWGQASVDGNNVSWSRFTQTQHMLDKYIWKCKMDLCHSTHWGHSAIRYGAILTSLSNQSCPLHTWVSKQSNVMRIRSDGLLWD